MRHLDLFSGIGGFALAAEMVGGIDTVAFCEIDPWAKKILAQNFPNIPIHNDITKIDGTKFKNIDILTGGYPCQPFSTAGNRKAENDPRHLWPAMLRVIRDVRPTWIICENVPGHIKLGLDQVLSDMDSEGYSFWPFVIPANATGLPHNRRRVYIVAHAPSNGFHEGATSACHGETHERTTERTDENRDNEGCRRVWAPLDWRGYSSRRRGIESTEIRVDDGLPYRMDRNKGLGNAIIPEIAAEILQVIKQYEL